MERLVFQCQNALPINKHHVIKELTVHVFINIQLKEILLFRLVDLKYVKIFTMHKIIKVAKISYQVNNVFIMVLIVFQKHNAVLTQLIQLVKEEVLRVKNQPFVHSALKKKTLKLVLVKHFLHVQMQIKMRLHVRLIHLVIGK